VLRLHAQLLGHVGDHVGLADCLSTSDRQGLVRICAIEERVFDEMLARDLIHCPQHGSVTDPALTQHQQELHPANFVVTGRRLRHARPPA
jgi:hypothetical protein